MLKFRKLFNKKCSVIGMVHLDALPGSPRFGGGLNRIISKAFRETEIYLENNIDGLLVENMNDIPYVQGKYLGPETTASMTRICTELKQIIPDTVPCGIQVLAGANREALAIAKICKFQFIRAEGFVFSHIADEGFTDANAGLVLRYRNKIMANHVLVFTDIKKKHSSHAITSDISLIETAKAAEFFMSDGLILTGSATGDPANIKELQDLKSSTELPNIIGSGVTLENLEDYVSADALIIGSYFKKNGLWQNEIDAERVKRFMLEMKKYQQ